MGRMAVFQRPRRRQPLLPDVSGWAPKRAGPASGPERIAGVRLQLDRAGQRSSYSQRQEVNEADILSSAPNLTIGSNRVQARRDAVSNHARSSGRKSDVAVTGDIVIEASPGRALAAADDSGRRRLGIGLRRPRHVGPAQRHAHGRRSARLIFDDGAGYHDHNWGFWKDVSWRWGQVHHGDLSLVYGRIRPPADAADAERIPGFLAAIGPDGPVGYATNVSIEETNDPATGNPRSIKVTGRSSSLDVAMELTVDNAIVTKRGGGLFDGELDFLQLRASYRVRGRAGDRSIDFTCRWSSRDVSGSITGRDRYEY